MSHPAPPSLWTLAAALAGGFVLSVLGMGLLWAGVPWAWQLGMGLPFGLLALAAAGRGAGAAPVLAGAAPLALLLVQFRSPDNSHLMPACTVLAWVAGALLGHHAGVRRRRATGSG